MVTPTESYERFRASPDFVDDPAQAYAVSRLQRLYDDLLASGAPSRGIAALLERWLQPQSPATVRGIYLWGGVGRGKTLLVDMFFNALPVTKKLRIHFHSFMRRVHGELKSLRERSEPLDIVASRLAAQARIICLDEFHVGDIADAMILGRLLERLFDLGTAIVATSNEAPDELYLHGLQRQRFLPTIELIKRHMEIVELDSPTDYRLRALERAEIYHHPLDDQADISLRKTFDEIAPDVGIDDVVIEIEGRPLKTRRHADGVVWFDFAVLCGGPRATADYIEIGRCYQSLLVSDIPQLDDTRNDATRRFINLIDEVYDRNVKFICSAAVPPEHLYSGTRLVKPFRRTTSRLVEMQSHEYLAQPHLSD